MKQGINRLLAACVAVCICGVASPKVLQQVPLSRCRPSNSHRITT